MKPQYSFSFLFFLVFPLLATSQGSEEASSDAEPLRLDRTQEWSELMSKEGVKVEYKYAECRDRKNDIHKENVLLRYSNSNEEPVKLSWKQLLWYDGKCRTCEVEGDEYRFELELEAGESKAGTCELGTPQKLQVFAKYLKSGNGLPDSELTGIDLDELRVK